MKPPPPASLFGFVEDWKRGEAASELPDEFVGYQNQIVKNDTWWVSWVILCPRLGCQDHNVKGIIYS